MGPAGRRYRSVAAWPALSRNCESVTLSADVGYRKLSAHLLLIYADVFRGRRSTYHPADYASEDGVSYVVFFCVCVLNISLTGGVFVFISFVMCAWRFSSARRVLSFCDE